MKVSISSNNCATGAYARYLQLFIPSASIATMDISVPRKFPKRAAKTWKESDWVITLPNIMESRPEYEEFRDKIIEIPTFYFSGYHPDVCYILNQDNEQLVTDLGSYHSLICFSGFEAGLSRRDTIALFNESVFEELGYFDDWDLSRETLLSAFSGRGLSLDSAFRKWAKGGCFMHTVNHPHSQCFRDIARLVAARISDRVLDVPYEIPDLLANGAVFPCYPEIALRNGCKGSYFFKLRNSERIIDLEEFVNLSFDAYEAHPPSSLKLLGLYKRKAAAFRSVILEDA